MRRATAIVLITLFVALIIFDIIAYVSSGPAATLSVVLADWHCKHPWLLLFTGFMGGHIVWPAKAR